MLQFWTFLRGHAVAGWGLFFGPFITVATLLNDAFTILTLPFPAQVWEAIGFGIFICSVIVLLYQFSKEHEQIKAANLSHDSQSEGQPPRHQSYLKNINILSGSFSPRLNPRFTAKFAQNGRRGRLYVDHSHFTGPRTRIWTGPDRVFLGEMRDFVAEQAIDIPILTSDEREGMTRWRWGSSENNSFVRATWHHRCRIAFIPEDDEKPEYFYFIVEEQRRDDEPPKLIPYYYFGFIKQWEGQ